jgi:hypothetical protein
MGLSKLIYINKHGEQKEYSFNGAAYKKQYIEKHNLKELMGCPLCKCEFQKVTEYHHKRTAKHIQAQEVMNNILMELSPEQQENKDYIDNLLQERLLKLKVQKQINNFKKRYNFENFEINIKCN